MTPERLASIRYWADANHGTRLNLPRAVSNSVILDMLALCDEVVRLRAWLQIMVANDDSDESWWMVDRAERALAGEAAPDGQ